MSIVPSRCLSINRVVLDESLHRAFLGFLNVQAEVVGDQVENVGISIGEISHEIDRVGLVVILADISLEKFHQLLINQIERIFIVQMVFEEIGERRKRAIGEWVVVNGAHNLVGRDFELLIEGVA